MVEDNQLIRQYAEDHSEAAFAELVRRHLKMVYSAALRHANGDSQLAQDVAQTVFLSLARKARSLVRHNSLAGWLYTSTRFAASSAIRAEARRRTREQTVSSMNETFSNSAPGWSELRPIIDDALSQLDDSDREAIVLRFFESCEFSAMSAALGVSESGARMRVERALEKLRPALQKRGLATTGAALAAALAESPGATVPAGLAAGIAGAVLAQSGGAAAGVSTSMLKIISMGKIAIVTAAALAVAVAAVSAFHKTQNPNNASATTSATSGAPAAAPSVAGSVAGAVFPARGGDPKVFEHLVERHDATVRTRGAEAADADRARWQKEWDGFQDSLKAGPGIKKYGVQLEATIGTNVALLTGGWRTEDGQNRLLMVSRRSPEELAALHPGSTPDQLSNQILLRLSVIKVPDESMTGQELSSFADGQNIRSIPMLLSNDEADKLIQSLTKGESDVQKSSILAKMDQTAGIVIGSQQTIGGKEQLIGLKWDILATRAKDESSVHLSLMIRYSIPTTGKPDANGQ